MAVPSSDLSQEKTESSFFGWCVFSMDFDPGTSREEVGGMVTFLEEVFPSLSKEEFRMALNFTRRGLRELRKKPYLWEVVVEMKEKEILELGSHTLTHPSFTGEYTGTTPLSKEEMEWEISAMVSQVEDAFGSHPYVFRAPFFDHTSEIYELEAKAGVRYDLSSYVPKGKGAFVPDVKVERTPSGKVAVIPTTLKLDPEPWREPIEVVREDTFTAYDPGRPFHCVVAHPWEFHESHPRRKDVLRAFYFMLEGEYPLVRCDEIIPLGRLI